MTAGPRLEPVFRRGQTTPTAHGYGHGPTLKVLSVAEREVAENATVSNGRLN